MVQADKQFILFKVISDYLWLQIPFNINKKG